MHSPAKRAAMGFMAAAIAVLTFHQGMWELLHLAAIPGLGMPTWFPMDPVPPLGVPKLLNLCFWGGLYGIVFGLLIVAAGASNLRATRSDCVRPSWT